MDSFANLLPMFAAMNGLPTKKAEGGSSDLAEFPDEVPSEKQLKDWLNVVDPVVRRSHGALLRGETPADLISTKATAERDLTGFDEIVLPAGGAPASAKERTDLMNHNQKVFEARRAKVGSQEQYDRTVAERKDQLAQSLVVSMRPRAINRLTELLTKHKVADNLHDGCAMYLDLVALQGSTGMHEEVRDHDREIEKMRDTPLADGCAIQEFSDYVNSMHEHLPHLERPLDGDALGKFIIKLMPKTNAGEGRALIRELSSAGTLSDKVIVISLCTQIVNESTTQENRVAAACIPRYSSKQVSISNEQIAMMIAAMGAAPAKGSGTGGARITVPSSAAAAAAVKAAATAAATKKAKAVAAALSTTNRSKKVGRLPDGAWCDDNTCQYDHAGKPCFSNPRTTQAQLEETQPRLATQPGTIKRFNDNKERNVAVRKVCDRSQLILFKVPPSLETRPAKGAVPFDAQSQFTDSMDGMPSLSPDMFYSIPSAPAVVVDLKNMTETMTLPCISVMQPFAGRILSLDKTWDSKCRNVLGPYLGGWVGIRCGQQEWMADGV